MPKHWVKIQSESALENLEAQKERSFDGAILCGDYIKEFDDWKKRLMALGIKEIWVDATASDEQQKRADGVFVDEGQSVGNVIHERFAVKADCSNWESIAQSGALFAWVDPAIRVASSAWLRRTGRTVGSKLFSFGLCFLFFFQMREKFLGKFVCFAFIGLSIRIAMNDVSITCPFT